MTDDDAVSRRDAMGALMAAAAFVAAGPALAQSGAVFSVDAFGAKGDGVADDYEALQAAARAVTQAGGGTLIFPNGTYLIGRYKIEGGPEANGVRDIVFENCKGLTIDLQGSTIVVAGGFHRSGDVERVKKTSGVKFFTSYRNPVVPFFFRNCRDTTLQNGRIDGGVRTMSRDPATGEGPGYGVGIFGCTRFRLANVTVAYCATDGIYVGPASGDVRRVSRYVTLENVVCTSNARQGLSITAGRWVTADGCIFERTGFDTGTYQFHAPGAGVDVEPNNVPPAIDVMTGHCIFRNCVFRDNAGFNFVATGYRSTDSVVLENCRFERSPGLPEGARSQCRVATEVLSARFAECTFLDSTLEAFGSRGWDGPVLKLMTEDCQFVRTRGNLPVLSFNAAQKTARWTLRRNTFVVRASGDKRDVPILMDAEGTIFAENTVTIQAPDAAAESAVNIVLRKAHAIGANVWTVLEGAPQLVLDLTESRFNRKDEYDGDIRVLTAGREG